VAWKPHGSSKFENSLIRYSPYNFYITQLRPMSRCRSLLATEHRRLQEYRRITNVINLKIILTTRTGRSRGSSGSIVSDYGLDYRAIGVRFPAGAKDFSYSLCVQTGSGAHPASCPMGTVGPFSRVKHGRGVTLITHPHLVPKSRTSMSYIASLPWHLHGARGTDLLYFVFEGHNT
jgi:hypothetical protein